MPHDPIKAAPIESGGDKGSEQAVRRFRDSVAPTYIQNWPPGLSLLSMPSRGVSIEPIERDAMIAALWASASGEEPSEDVRGGLPHDRIRPLLDSVAAKLDPVIASVAGDDGKAFVRLGSRSPKDSWKGMKDGFAVRTGSQALAILLDSMERIHDDLQSDRLCGAESWLYARKWIDLPEWAEFRCVLRDGIFAGACQYDYMKGIEYPQILSAPDIVLQALSGFAARVAAVSPLDTVIFDVGFEAGDIARPVLVEINPFGDLTDPCLFRDGWPEPSVEGPVFRYHGDGRDYGLARRPGRADGGLLVTAADPAAAPEPAP